MREPNTGGGSLVIRDQTLLSVDHSGLNRKKEQREIQLENKRISVKMSEIYQSKKISLYGQQKELGQTIDCNKIWSGRTELYSASTSKSTSRPTSASISSSLGLAICSGCGVKSFSGADGPNLYPCSSCRRVFYCSATCQSIDLQSHKMLCKYEASPHKGSPMSLVRPTQDYWVQNKSMQIAREELHHRAARHLTLTAEDEVEERARVAKLVQLSREKEEAAQARQRKIEWLADNNMDGPRPCMYENGLRI